MILSPIPTVTRIQYLPALYYMAQPSSDNITKTDLNVY